MAVPTREHLDRCRGSVDILDHGRHDLTVGRVGLGAHHHPVAVADGGLDHRVPVHLQHEELTLAGQTAGQCHDIGDVLLRQDRRSGGDPPHQRDGDRVPVLDAGNAGGVD